MRAVEDAVDEELRERRSEGLVIFASEGEVTHLDRLPSTPAEHAEFAPLPHVLPYLVQRGERFAYVSVTADRRGGEVTCVAADGERSTVHVQGDEDYPIRKTKAGDWNQSRFQRAAEEAWKANAKKVARAVDTCVKQAGAEAIIVNGDPQVRGAILEEITDLDKVVETADPDGVLELKTVERVAAVTARSSTNSPTASAPSPACAPPSRPYAAARSRPSCSQRTRPTASGSAPTRPPCPPAWANCAAWASPTPPRNAPTPPSSAPPPRPTPPWSSSPRTRRSAPSSATPTTPPPTSDKRPSASSSPGTPPPDAVPGAARHPAATGPAYESAPGRPQAGA
ncbi:hypothetical protein J4573_00035 [Actinomadura barringtoniae]|uniref:Actinobacteria/chloroflexi VLRF1 release factor domain-containing protein n=1 Tax=Actinomadura barringtoniae TaxID=1427535 RepID=A0A939PBL1_9ACTN|nr:hypothetical protein [Actinomadura barringtoniae]